jgi:hypothetical protein
MRGARLVSKRSFNALITGLFACASAPTEGDGLGRLRHFRPARRDEVVYSPHSSINHPDADLDNAKSLQRDIGGLATNEPRAENAEEAHANEQHRKRNGGKASCLFKDSHAALRCFFSGHGLPATINYQPSTFPVTRH